MKHLKNKTPFINKIIWMMYCFMAILLISSVAFTNDERGAIKEWGAITIELKDYSFNGRTANIVLLMKNPTDQEETISSLLYFQAITEEGDLGDMSWTETKCDGTIPPQGVFKCRLSYEFPVPPLEVNLRVGAGIMTDAIYFKIKK